MGVDSMHYYQYAAPLVSFDKRAFGVDAADDFHLYLRRLENYLPGIPPVVKQDFHDSDLFSIRLLRRHHVNERVD